MRHCQHPADLSSTRALDWQQCPGGTGTALPWPLQPWSSQAAAVPAPAPAASFHLPLTHSSAGSGTAPSLGTSCSSSPCPLHCWCYRATNVPSRAGDTKAAQALYTNLSSPPSKSQGWADSLTSVARCTSGSPLLAGIFPMGFKAQRCCPPSVTHPPLPPELQFYPKDLQMVPCRDEGSWGTAHCQTSPSSSLGTAVLWLRLPGHHHRGQDMEGHCQHRVL